MNRDEPNVELKCQSERRYMMFLAIIFWFKVYIDSHGLDDHLQLIETCHFQSEKGRPEIEEKRLRNHNIYSSDGMQAQ